MPTEAFYPFDPDWVVSPGAILQEELEERDIRPAVLAKAMSVEPEVIDGFLRGEVPLTLALAIRLARALVGSTESVQMWLNLEKIYRDGLAAGKKDMSS